MDDRFDVYLKALAKAYEHGGTEHTGRTALENLLNAFAAEALDPGIRITHEAGREDDKGAPDFKVTTRGMILGYIEVKEIGANLDKVLKSPQIQIIPIGEKNPKWLNDDYVKFIRFAQLKMDEVPEGIVGVITNHSWLVNPTFRAMRQSLMRTFDQIYIIDLHGSTNPPELAPTGCLNENVFDIKKGVAVALFVKKRATEKRIYRNDVWGTRLEKYIELAGKQFKDVSWQSLRPDKPQYVFSNRNEKRASLYETCWLLPAIFDLESVGIVTGRDRLAVQFTRNELLETVHEFAESDPDVARNRWQLGDDVRDWRVAWAQSDVLNNLNNDRATPIAYRPFDIRWTYYTGKSRGFHCYPRDNTSRLMVDGNIALLSARTNKSFSPDHFFVSENISEAKTAESTTQSYFFPMNALSGSNFSGAFHSYIDSLYDQHRSPEEIFGYIYSVVYSPTYRRLYGEFLKTDFPRIPFPENADDFETLSVLGWALVEAHLLRDLPRGKLADYHGRGSNEVEHVRWSSEDRRISINAIQSFAPMPEEVWNFHIGGYQVIDKYLKSRKGRVLSLDEIDHVGRIADALAFTIDQIKAIDVAYRHAFPRGG